MESWAALRTTFPGHVEERAGPRPPGRGRARLSGSARRSRDRSARAAACFTSTRLEPTPIRRFERDPDRSSPSTRGQALGGGPVQVFGQRGDAQVHPRIEPVGLVDHPAEPWLERLVVGAVHEQEGIPGPEERAHLLEVGVEPTEQGLGVVGQGRPLP